MAIEPNVNDSAERDTELRRIVRLKTSPLEFTTRQAIERAQRDILPTRDRRAANPRFYEDHRGRQSFIILRVVTN